MGSYFCVLVFILVGGVIFVEEKFAYRRSIKKLTAPAEDLFSARLAGVRATAEINIRFINTLSRDALSKQRVHVVRKYRFPFHS